MYVFHERLRHTFLPDLLVLEDHFEFYFVDDEQGQIPSKLEGFANILGKIQAAIEEKVPKQDVLYEAAMVVLPEPCKPEKVNKDAEAPLQECLTENLSRSMFEHFEAYFEMFIKKQLLKNVSNFGKYMYYCKRTGAIIVSVYHSTSPLPDIDTMKRAKAWERGSMHDSIDNGLARMSVWFTKKNLKETGPAALTANGKFVLPDPKKVFQGVVSSIALNDYSEGAKVIASRSVDLTKTLNKLRYSILLSEF